MNMDKTTPSSSSNTTVSSKKLPFTSAERELIVALVRERPIIEDKRTHAKNIQLKKETWANLTVAYNSQPYVTQRLTLQLKRCWENIKTQRKKELSQESISLKSTGGGPPENGSFVSDNVIDTICPFINLRVPEVIDSNTIEILTDTLEPYYGKDTEESVNEENPFLKDEEKKPQYVKIPEPKYENATTKVIDPSTSNEENENHSRKRTVFAMLENGPDENSCLQPKRKNKDTFSTPTSSKKFISETEARVKRSTINIQQDQALHELRIQRESILIKRENNLLEFEKKIHDLQIQKLKLEIELLTKQIENKTS